MKKEIKLVIQRHMLQQPKIYIYSIGGLGDARGRGGGDWVKRVKGSAKKTYLYAHPRDRDHRMVKAQEGRGQGGGGMWDMCNRVNIKIFFNIFY